MKGSALEKFLGQEATRKTMELPGCLTLILDFLEYLVRSDFDQADKKHLLTKTRRNQISNHFREALITLSPEEKVYYYCMVVGFVSGFVSGQVSAPKRTFSGGLSAVGFSRSFTIKRWKEKQLRFDLQKHILSAEREKITKSYDMRNYLLRRSKNKDYHCFVLEAINSTPHEKSMTVHIGFKDEAILNEWVSALNFSVLLRQWEFYLHLFQSGGGLPLARFPLDHNRSLTAFEPEDRQHMQKEVASTSLLPQSRNSAQNHQSPQEKLRERVRLEQELRQLEGGEGRQTERTLVDELVQGQMVQEPGCFEERVEAQPQSVRNYKRHLDLFHKLYPEYELEDLPVLSNFELVHESQGLKVYRHTHEPRRIKLLAEFPRDRFEAEGGQSAGGQSAGGQSVVEQVLSVVSKPEAGPLCNEAVESAQVKTFIPSQNSALVYQVNRSFSRFYRPRDFVFIRHVFRQGGVLYMVDKSIDNVNYPPFLTIVRAQMANLYGLFPTHTGLNLIADLDIRSAGLLNASQDADLALRFACGFVRLQDPALRPSDYRFFATDWDIDKNKANTRERQLWQLRKSISQLAASQLSPPQWPLEPPGHLTHCESLGEPPLAGESLLGSPVRREAGSVEGEPQVLQLQGGLRSLQVGELLEQPEQEQGRERWVAKTVENQLDSSGLVVVRQDFRQHRFGTQALSLGERSVLGWSQGLHPIWKDEWIHDDKEGFLVFVHRKKIEDQKGVLKFILSKLAKNLVSGQSITNISLPVDIFTADSNLERFLLSMSYAPVLLEGLQQEDPLRRLVRTFAFGITNSIMYLSMEKPFNPILGETFQCWLDGCPGYAEQISHHPPIGALLLQGRGYRVSGQFESKVSLGVNSGTGLNDGVYRVLFDDGLELCFTTPGGEVSGLTHGDRRFALVGKAYYWVPSLNWVMEVSFDLCRKGLFSFRKKGNPPDYFEGTIWEVRPEFMQKFLAGKRREPEQKERVRNLGKLSGIWSQSVCFEGKEVFSFDRDFPVLLEYEKSPLPSDSNWREDIEYRRRKQYPRAQAEKERLQVLQRKDRKLREKWGPKKKH